MLPTYHSNTYFTLTTTFVSETFVARLDTAKENDCVLISDIN